jgi:LacI family transcriptional regulator
MDLAKKVTMQLIADELGISKFAVSKALAGKPGVSPSTRERVYRTANDLGYFVQKANYSVYSVAPDFRSNGVVVVLFPDLRYQTKEPSYWGPIVEGITEELKNHNLNMVMLTDTTGESVSKIINLSGLDGVISVGRITQQMLLEVQAQGIPIVLIDHYESNVAADKLFMNNFDCMRQLTDQLVGMGHRTFQYVGNVNFARSFYERWLGFRASLESHGLPYEPIQELLELTDQVFDTNEEMKGLLEPLIERQNLPDVLVCGCDKIAINAITALRELGKPVPQDCSVTGFDNILESVKVSPKLTTVDVPKEMMGARAVQMLLWRKANRHFPSETVLLPGRIWIRESLSLSK